MSFLRSFLDNKPKEAPSFPALEEFEKYYNSQNSIFLAILRGEDPKTGKTVSDIMLQLVSAFTKITKAGISADIITLHENKLLKIKKRINDFCIEAITNISNAKGVNEANINSIENSLKTYNELYKKIGLQEYKPPIYRG